jgi:hypothetical protein
MRAWAGGAVCHNRSWRPILPVTRSPKPDCPAAAINYLWSFTTSAGSLPARQCLGCIGRERQTPPACAPRPPSMNSGTGHIATCWRRLRPADLHRHRVSSPQAVPCDYVEEGPSLVLDRRRDLIRSICFSLANALSEPCPEPGFHDASCSPFLAIEEAVCQVCVHPSSAASLGAETCQIGRDSERIRVGHPRTTHTGGSVVSASNSVAWALR